MSKTTTIIIGADGVRISRGDGSIRTFANLQYLAEGYAGLANEHDRACEIVNEQNERIRMVRRHLSDLPPDSPPETLALRDKLKAAIDHDIPF